MIRAYIFPINTPWGIEKDNQGRNIYRNAINFPKKDGSFNEKARDEFVNTYMCKPEQPDFKKNLQRVEFSNANFQLKSETTIVLRSTIGKRDAIDFTDKQSLLNSDYCVVEFKDKPNKYYFYALSVVQNNPHNVVFRLELDIFFTHQLTNELFLPKAQAFLNRGHMDLWHPKLKNVPLLDNILRHQTPNMELTRQKEVLNIYKDDKQNIRFMFIYVYRDKLDEFFNKFPELSFSEISVVSGIVLPYVIFMIPFNIKSYQGLYLTQVLSSQFDDNIAGAHGAFLGTDKHSLDTTTIIQKLIRDKAGVILDNVIVDDPPFNFWDTFSLHSFGGALYITPKDNVDTFQAGVMLYSKTYRDVESNKLKKLWFFTIWNTENMKPFTKTLYFRTKFDNPMLLSPIFHKVRIKTWESSHTDYILPYLDHFVSNNAFEYNTLFNFSPSSPTSLQWLTQDHTLVNNNDYTLVNGNYLQDTVSKSLPLSETALTQFKRDNSNSFNTLRQYNKYQFVGTALGTSANMLMGIANMNPMGTAQSFLGGGMSILNAHKAIAMQDSQIDDLKNRVPNVVLGEGLVFTQLLHKIYPQSKGAKIILMSLLPHEEDKLLDDIKISGIYHQQNVRIKDIINSRTHFNYVEGEMVFTNIAKKLSSNIKEQIGKAFKDGLHIWHYRGKDMWGGVSNFDTPNTQISKQW